MGINRGRRVTSMRSWGTVVVAMISSGVFVLGVLWGYPPFSAFRPTSTVLSLDQGPGCHALGISGNAEWDRYSSDEYVQALRETRALGAGRVRIGANWGEIETEPGRRRWEALDERVRIARQAGLDPLLVLQTVPSWVTIPSGPTSPEHLRLAEGFGDFAHAVAARYGDDVDAYEVWNEPNLPRFWPEPDVTHYLEFLRAAYGAIHRADPGATVITGGLAPAPDANGSIAPLTFLQRLYDLGGREYLDAIGMHPYSYPEMPSGTSVWNTFRSLKDVKRLMASRGDWGKKIWITEYGAPTGGSNGVSPDAQAAMIVEAYRLAAEDPMLGPVFVYTMIDGGAPKWDPEFHFGLYYVDQTPKPAVRALQDAVVDCPVRDYDAEVPPPAGPHPGDSLPSAPGAGSMQLPGLGS
ncbi:hypothetical protein [Dietzia sp. 179-F 9C3 NHS]|uniref:hypothetical protein n=1 Tax=Dietzia sp. 179-F 9C3 NHS TaxID=3374295 RepID=UPI00387A65C1